jgi:hypothetical protein
MDRSADRVLTSADDEQGEKGNTSTQLGVVVWV